MKQNIAEEDKPVLNEIDSCILNNKHLSDYEKLQVWIWIYSNYNEERFSSEDLSVLLEHIKEHEQFFPKLLQNLKEINEIIKKKDSVALIGKLEEAVSILKTLKTLENI